MPVHAHDTTTDATRPPLAMAWMLLAASTCAILLVGLAATALIFGSLGHWITPRWTFWPRLLVACALTDLLRDGLSMVYSFFHPGEDDRSLGTQMILDHIREAKGRELPHVYLGYWVEGSEKMAYKTRFKPMQALGRDGWQRI